MIQNQIFDNYPISWIEGNPTKKSKVGDYAFALDFLRYNQNGGADIVNFFGVQSIDQRFINVNIIFDSQAELKNPQISEREAKVWSAVKELIPTFEISHRVYLTHSFVERVFAPIIPDSPGCF